MSLFKKETTLAIPKFTVLFVGSFALSHIQSQINQKHIANDKNGYTQFSSIRDSAAEGPDTLSTY